MNEYDERDRGDDLALGGSRKSDRFRSSELQPPVSTLSYAFEWIELGDVFARFENPQDALTALKRDLEEQGKTLDGDAVRQMGFVLSHLFVKYHALKPWRERVAGEEGKREYLKQVGKGHIDSSSVRIDLSHPIFIGVEFSTVEEAHAFKNKVFGEDMNQDIDSLGAWVTLGSFDGDALLDGSTYFTLPAPTQDERNHEIQHLLFMNGYDPRMRKMSRKPPFPITNEQKTNFTREDIEIYYMLNELLAYLKGNQMPLYSSHMVNTGVIRKEFSRLSTEDHAILMRKFVFFRDKIGGRLLDRAIPPRALWAYAQAAQSFDEALNYLFEALYSPEEQEAFYSDQTIEETTEGSRARFRKALAQFESKQFHGDPERSYQEESKLFSPEWVQNFEVLASAEVWTAEERYWRFLSEKTYISRWIGRYTKALRKTLPDRAREWMDEMVEGYPYLDQRPDVVKALVDDACALHFLERMDEFSFGSLSEEQVQKTLKAFNKDRQRLMRYMYEYAPFQSRREEIIRRINDKAAEIRGQ